MLNFCVWFLLLNAVKCDNIVLFLVEPDDIQLRSAEILGLGYRERTTLNPYENGTYTCRKQLEVELSSLFKYANKKLNMSTDLVVAENSNFSECFESGRKQIWRMASVLHNITEYFDKLNAKKKPFVLVVIGGKLSDLSVEESDLFQSLRYLQEKETDVIITGYCLESELKSIPVWVRSLADFGFIELVKKLSELPSALQDHLDYEIYQNELMRNKRQFRGAGNVHNLGGSLLIVVFLLVGLFCN